MQEVEQEIGRQLVIVVKGAAKLTPRILAKALSIAGKTANAPAEYRRKKTIKKEQKQTALMQRHGKMTVKELAEKDKGMTSIELHDSSFRDFSRIARKYGIDYAIRKDASVHPPKYLVFFKAKDADALTAAFNEYSAKALKKSERPSVLKQLRQIAAKIAELPGRVVNRDKKRELDR